MIKILSTLVLAAAMPLAILAEDSPLPPVAGEVLKLSQSQVGAEVIKNYIQNSTAACNLTADQIISLRKAGVADDLLAALLRHGGELQRKSGSTTISAPVPIVVSNVQAPPPAVTITTNVITVVERPVYAAPVYVSPGYRYDDYDYYPRSSFSFSFGIPFGNSCGYGYPHRGYYGGWGASFGHGWHR